MHLNTRTMRWSVPRGAERSRYYITVKETVSQAMHVGGRHSYAVICSVILASLSNSYVEGSAQFIGACTGQTVRNHLRYQDPSGMILVNDYVIERLSSAGTFSKKSILAIDAHDIMYYGDPAAEGVIGTKPRKGSHWAYEFATISVLLDGERVTLAAVPTLRGPMVWHVRALIEHALSLGIKPWLILLDGAYTLQT